MILTILGSHSATPLASAHPTAQILEMKGHIFLIDCGEGTQMQLRKYKIKFSRIKHIFISHLHGDHFFGLPGLITTFMLMGRETEVHIYGPKGIKNAILTFLKVGKVYTNYPLYFHELETTTSEMIFEDEKVSVETIPLDHRVYTNGYLFKEKPNDRKLNVEAARAANVDLVYYNRIKKGEDVVNREGVLIPNEEITFDPEPPKSYAFCSDTVYKPEIAIQIRQTTVLYHESTFLEDRKDLAEKTMHSTAKQAALIAKAADVTTLILGHYSARYGDLNLFKKEAETVFPNVYLAEDGKRFEF